MLDIFLGLISDLGSLVGEVPFLSKVTGNVEQLPVAISLLGAPGMFLDDDYFPE
jgi:hypothetical protein